MNLLSPKIIKGLLSKYGTEPRKRFGQNFLISPGVLKKIIEAANLRGDETVLEIGPGIGTLTQELAQRAKKVIAIEKDRKMVEIFAETLKEYKNVQILQGDILKFSISNFSRFARSRIAGQFSNNTPDVIPAKAGIQVNRSGSRVTRPNARQNDSVGLASGGREPGMTRTLDYKIVANLPYYITSPVIRKFLESENPPSEMILMVQKEVAQRICASPRRSHAERGEGGQNRMSLLAVSVQFYAKPEIVSYVSKGSFWPSPKVDSAILRITPEATPIHGLHPDDTDINIRVGASVFRKAKDRASAFRVQFFQVVRAGFSSPRKQLAGNLAKGLKIERHIIEGALKEAGIEPSQRAETLGVEEWIKVTKEIGILGN